MSEREMSRDLDPSLVRHEEELQVGKTLGDAGSVHASKRVETETVEEVVPRWVEQANVERLAPGEWDSGQVETLPDGSISIPVLEERLVVTKQLVVRERIVIRKEWVTEHERVTAELKRERVDVEGRGGADIVADGPSAEPGPSR